MFTFESAPPARKTNFTRVRHEKPPIEEDEMDWEDDDLQENQLAIPGEDIASFQSYMRCIRIRVLLNTSNISLFRGHGTYVENQRVVSSVAGTVERVNKLISVRAVSSR
jgi:exosome complex component RRP4